MTTTVRVGQVWADNDPRCHGRRVRVVEVTDTHAIVEVHHTSHGAYRHAKPGRATRIRLDRFRPTSTGYVLVQDAPAPCCDLPSAAPCDADDCPGTRQEAQL